MSEKRIAPEKLLTGLERIATERQKIDEGAGALKLKEIILSPHYKSLTLYFTDWGELNFKQRLAAAGALMAAELDILRQEEREQDAWTCK